MTITSLEKLEGSKSLPINAIDSQAKATVSPDIMRVKKKMVSLKKSMS